MIRYQEGQLILPIKWLKQAKIQIHAYLIPKSIGVDQRARTRTQLSHKVPKKRKFPRRNEKDKEGQWIDLQGQRRQIYQRPHPYKKIVCLKKFKAPVTIE